MNRTDRLVAIVMFLQGRRVVRAEELATHFEISLRTVYRDVSALGEAGVPVVGEAGVGYSLVKGYHLPPVLFTADEAAALFVGGEMVKRFTDASLREPADSALLKIRSVLPRNRQDELERLEHATEIARLPRLPGGPDRRVLLPIQQALVSRRVLRLTYRARDRDTDTERDVEPLGVIFHDGVWYLVAWCRLRRDLRHFRLDRIRHLAASTERFEPRPGFSLRRHLAEVGADAPRIPVRVWFHERALERARAESHHETRSESPMRDGSEVAMETYSLDWAARWILSFGAEAEALAPVELRKRVFSLAQEALRRHSTEMANDTATRRFPHGIPAKAV